MPPSNNDDLVSKNRQAAKALIEIFSLFQELNEDMPIKQALLFLGVVAATEEPTLGSLCQTLNLPASTASKNISQLAGFDKGRGLPVPLIVQNEDPMERRRKLISLTPAGKQLSNKLLAKIVNQAAA